MTDVKTVAAVAEREILDNSGAAGSRTCQAWMELPSEDRIAFAGAAKFLGCQGEPLENGGSRPTAQEDRIAVARMMLLKLGLYQCEPWWSSSVLDKVVSTAAAFPGGSVRDLYDALCGILRDYPCDLSATMANFLRDFVVRCCTRHSDSYKSVDWRAVAGTVNEDSTTAQLYLAFLAIPPRDLTPEVESLIERRLESTPHLVKT